ncbi:hypothetical protein chiPu_0001765 [Chiloscyllium punctatum]|uniref:Uncharacterized protein n=1 Tax=Chiloscyllium punctatum TaxID=137246 RepID=A0A401RYZ0_CHIPU|nr:hypothetical protein [Chiloscyllium punctatum]
MLCFAPRKSAEWSRDAPFRGSRRFGARRYWDPEEVDEGSQFLETKMWIEVVIQSWVGRGNVAPNIPYDYPSFPFTF